MKFRRGVLIPVLLVLVWILITAFPASGERPGRQTIGPWYGVFTYISTGLRGIGRTTKWEWVFDALESKVLEIQEKNPYVKGVTVKILWRHINPSENVYNFEGLDKLLHALEKNEKHVILSMATGGMSAPDWIYDKGAEKFVSSTEFRGRRLYGPVPWDEKYINLLEKCLEELSKKINDDPRVFAVCIYGHNFIGQEMSMSYGNSKEDLRKWDALGRSDRVVFDNWKHWVDLYARFFSKKKIILTLGPMYGEWKRLGHLTDELAQYAMDKYPDKVILQILALHGRFDGLGICPVYRDLDKCADELIRNRDKVSSGFETLGPFIRQPRRQGNVEMTVYNALKANPLYIQLWYEDAIHPKGAEIAKQIEDFYKKYKNWTLEDMRDEIKRQGKYLQNYRWERREEEDTRPLWRKQRRR